MSTVLLPRLSNTVILRPRLSWLHDRPRPSLVVVWATAGSGKTTLLSTWAEELTRAGESVAWITVPAGRSGGDALETLISRAFESTTRASDHHTLFIDDAHLASGRRDRQWLSDFAAAPVDGLTVVLAGRYQPVVMPRATYADPSVELRTRDLAFTEQETAQYFGERGIDLSSAQVRSVVERTDGWAVALSLMASRLGHTNDIDAFIHAFSGDFTSVADYLVTEVLAGQPDAHRRFLLETSVVDELTVPLAAYLTGRTNAGEILDELEEDNTLTRAPGGDPTTWHYHSLLRDHLRAQLRSHDYAGSLDLHRFAAGWFLSHGQPELGLTHSLSTDDPAYVRTVLETVATSLVFSGQGSLVSRALDYLTGSQNSTPSSHLVSALLAAPHFYNTVTADHHLAIATEHADELPPHLRTLVWSLTLMRASGLRAIAEAESCLAHAEAELAGAEWNPALDEAALDAKLFADAARGFAEIGRENHATASAALQRCARDSGMATRPWLSMLLLDAAASSSAAAGRWSEASTIESLMTSAFHSTDQTRDPASALAHLTIATAAYTSCDPLRPALLRDVIETGESENDAGLVVPGRVLTELFAVDGCANPRSSFEELDRCLRSASQVPRTLAIACYRYLDLTLRFRGRPRAREAVQLLAATLGSHSVDYRLCCALLSSGTSGQETEARELETALESPAYIWHPSNLVLGWLLLSRWAETSGRMATADERLHRALDLAGQMRARRPFMASTGFGARLVETRQGRLGPNEAFGRTILDSYHRIYSPSIPAFASAGSLTRKEHDILRELPHHQSIAEIARKQQLSSNTVKTHLRSIYEKFGVNGRFEAVEHATRSGLI